MATGKTKVKKVVVTSYKTKVSKVVVGSPVKL